MAKLHLALALVLLLVMSLLATQTDAKRSSPKRPTHFTFYLHNTVYNETLRNVGTFNSVFVARPKADFPNPWSFGVLATFEDPLTARPSPNSTQIGVGQGFYMYDSLKGYMLFQAFTATISTPKYKGTIDIFGQIQEALPKRTLTVIGGTGDFLLARGVATCRLTDLYSGPLGPAHWTLSFHLRLYY